VTAGMILVHAPVALPVSGLSTEAQVRNNFGSNEKAPLRASVMAEIDAMLLGFKTEEANK